MPVTPSLHQQFADRMGQLLGPQFPRDIALAVSGGGDSMAMLHLAAGWAHVYGIRLWVVTVDHGLRDASGSEAAMVAREAAGLGLPHSTLKWRGWDGIGNLQDAARDARRDLIGRWRGVCRHVLMAHTRDDQAETLLMRLARGSGVDGLAAMAGISPAPAPDRLDPLTVQGGPPQRDPPDDGFAIVRPLLDVDRADLRHFLTALHIPFVDDPSNDDVAYARVRMRRLIGAEGLDTATLAATARRMARARVALCRRAHDVAQDLLMRRADPMLGGAVALRRDDFAGVEEETQLRILAAALQLASGATYRPRASALDEALERLRGGGTTTLHGGVIVPHGDTIYIAREPARTEGPVLATAGDVLWDRRWRISVRDNRRLTVRALGEDGLAQIPDKPVPRPPMLAVAALPSLWDRDELVGCHGFGFGLPHGAELKNHAGNLLERLLAH